MHCWFVYIYIYIHMYMWYPYIAAMAHMSYSQD